MNDKVKILEGQELQRSLDRMGDLVPTLDSLAGAHMLAPNSLQGLGTFGIPPVASPVVVPTTPQALASQPAQGTLASLAPPGYFQEK